MATRVINPVLSGFYPDPSICRVGEDYYTHTIDEDLRLEKYDEFIAEATEGYESKDLANKNITMIIVTHEMKFAREVSTRIFYMDEGIVYEEGSPDQIFNNY